MEEYLYPSGPETGSDSGLEERKQREVRGRRPPRRRPNKAPAADYVVETDVSSSNTPTVTSGSRGPLKSSRDTSKRRETKSSWVSFFDNLGLFQCGGGTQAEPHSDGEDEVYTFDEDPFGLMETSGGCPLFRSNHHPDLVFTEEQTRAGWSAWTPHTGDDDDIILREDSLVSPMKAKPTKRAWSTPPRLDDVNVSALRRNHAFRHKPSFVPTILPDVFHFSDMDTFLSDEFTEMELGYFNGLYDQICKPVSARRLGHARKPLSCSAMGYDGPSSVVLSFDDNISKLTMDDGKSLSTASLNTMENLKKTAVDRATIAAIVKAQAKGGWRSKAQEDAEAKAEELSRFGIEHTLSDSGSGLPPDQPEPQDASDNVIVVRHYGDEESQVEVTEQPWKAIQSTFASSLEHEDQVDRTETEEGEEDDLLADTKDTGSSKSDHRRRFLKAFNRRKRKSKNDTTKTGNSPSSKSKRSWGLMTPPRKPKQRDAYAPSPTSTTMTAPSSVSMTGESAKSPSEIEEVEVISKKREPVYTSYIRTESDNLMENIEILRRESIAAEFGGSAGFTSELESAIQEEDTESHDVLETVTEEVSEALAPSWELSQNGREQQAGEASSSSDTSVPALGDLDDDEDTSTNSSLSPPSLAEMTSRLAKASEEIEQLRLMLEEKDEDLEQMKEFLESNESAAVVERVNSCGSNVK